MKQLEIEMKKRTAARKKKIVAHRARNFADAELWDLQFWQSQTPEMRLSALVELRNDLDKVHDRNRTFDDE